jgi:hypothetical protein
MFNINIVEPKVEKIINEKKIKRVDKGSAYSGYEDLRRKYREEWLGNKIDIYG